MGWQIGYDSNWQRDIGYGVPAYCDHPGCMAEIDRGLSYVCGGGPHGESPRQGERDGCGLFFCGKHGGGYHCARCRAYKRPYKRLSPEHPDWIAHKLTDESWARWRAENPEELIELTRLAERRAS